jgi:hypothetical protein
MANSKPSFSPGLGLPLSSRELAALKAASIQAHTIVSLHFQGKSKRWVLRAEESGGGTVAIGHFVGFVGVGTTGFARSFSNQTFQPNSGHRLVYAESMVRFELFRYGTNCHLLISHHSVAPIKGEPSEAKRPAHIRRNLLLEHWGHIQTDGSLLFLDRAGEDIDIPEYLKPYIKAALAGTKCRACMCAHFEALPSIQLPIAITQPALKPMHSAGASEGQKGKRSKRSHKKQPQAIPANVPELSTMEAAP